MRCSALLRRNEDYAHTQGVPRAGDVQGPHSLLADTSYLDITSRFSFHGHNTWPFTNLCFPRSSCLLGPLNKMLKVLSIQYQNYSNTIWTQFWIRCCMGICWSRGLDIPAAGRQVPQVQVLSKEQELSQKLRWTWLWVEKMVNSFKNLLYC